MGKWKEQSLIPFIQTFQVEESGRCVCIKLSHSWNVKFCNA